MDAYTLFPSIISMPKLETCTCFLEELTNNLKLPSIISNAYNPFDILWIGSVFAKHFLFEGNK